MSASKKRPAFVLATLKGDDVLLCQITSKHVSDSYAIGISSQDFQAGKLRQNSHIRPNRIFTADSNIILYRTGKLADDKVREVVAKVIEIVSV